MKPTDLKYFDQRTVKRNVYLGFIKKEDHDKFIKQLPDDSDNLSQVSFEEIEASSEEKPNASVTPEDSSESNTEKPSPTPSE